MKDANKNELTETLLSSISLIWIKINDKVYNQQVS